MFKKDELKLLWPFYLYYAVFGLSMMIMPFLIIYFRDLGFSFFQISLITGSFGLGMFLFEVPTGSFADKFSRKYSVIWGFIITGVSVFLIPAFSNYLIILLLWLFAGIGMTFISGAEESWVVDNLKKSKREDLRQGFFIKSQSLAGIGAVIAPLVGTLLVKQYPIALLWKVFGLGFFISAIILFFAKELYKPKNNGLLNSIKEGYKESFQGFNYIKKNKNLTYLILGTVFTFSMTIGTDGWTPLIRNYGMEESYLGILFSGIALLSVIFMMLSKYLAKYDIRKVVSATRLIRALLLISVTFIYPPMFFVLGIIMLFEDSIIKLSSPLLNNYIHDLIPTKIRATVISSRSMIAAFTGTIVSLSGGYLMDLFGPQKVIASGAIFAIFAVICYMKIKPN